MRSLILVIGLLIVGQGLFAQDKTDKKIGIVRVSEVLDKYKGRLEKEKEFKANQDKLISKMKDKRNEIEKLKEESINTDDDVEREKISLELLKAKKDLENFGELNQEVLQREYVKAQLEMIREIKKTIQDYGVENKFFLILQAQPSNAKQGNIQEALLNINLSDVMYYDANYDITDKIVELLNLRYDAKKSATKK